MTIRAEVSEFSCIPPMIGGFFATDLLDDDDTLRPVRCSVGMHVWTTEGQLPQHQFSYWREVLCEAFVALDPIRKSPEVDFVGKVRSRSLGQTMHTEIFSRAQFVNRRLEEIRRDPVMCYFANFQIEGSCVVRQDGRTVLIDVGDFAIVDTTRPYFLDMRGDWRILSFRIRHSLLEPKLASPRKSTALAVTGGSGAGLVAKLFARSLDSLDMDMELAAADGMSAALSSVIAAALGASLANQDSDEVILQSARRRAIEAYISENLADQSLSPETIAARFRLSRRTLYNIFEDAPESVSGTIRCLRLEGAARDLARSSRRTVLDIALRWGFNDPAHFSRLFRRNFGASPRDYAAMTNARPQLGSSNDEAT